MDRREYKKCVIDESRIYIIEKYLLPILINDKECSLTEYQKEILKSFDGKNSLYINKSRQIGLTTLFTLKIAADIILSEGDEVFLFYGCNQVSFDMVKKNVKELLLKCPENIWTYMPQYRQRLTFVDKDILKIKSFCKEDLIFNTDNFGKIINGFEVSNGCVLKNICSPSDIDVKNGIFNHRGVMKKVKYAVLDEWIFKDNAKVIIEYLKNEKITMLMGTTPNCDTDLCYDIAKEFKDKGQFIEALWEDCPWKRGTKFSNLMKYGLKETEYLSESGKIFKIVML